MAQEIAELHEQAEHGSNNPKLAPVTITMAILAVLVASVSLMGERIHEDVLVSQTKVTDQWSFYQAKAIRERSYEVFEDQLTVFVVQSPAKADEIKGKYDKEIDRYKGEMKDIQTEATKIEAEIVVLMRESNRFDLGEVLLEAALVICSITLLTEKRVFWLLGSAMGLSGVLIACSGFLIH
jgi:uncharacterized protein DUF4337